MTPGVATADLRVLAVVESVVVLIDIEDTLQEIGITRIRATSSPSHALAAVLETEFDLALLGLEGNEAGRQQLLDALREKAIPVLLVASGTSQAQPLLPPSANSVSVPFDTPTLAEAVAATLSARR